MGELSTSSLIYESRVSHLFLIWRIGSVVIVKREEITLSSANYNMTTPVLMLQSAGANKGQVEFKQAQKTADGETEEPRQLLDEFMWRKSVTTILAELVNNRNRD